MTSGPVRLLGYAIRYAAESVDAVVPGSESLPTPCEGWDLRTLLSHLNDSVDELRRAVASEPGDRDPAGAPVARPASTFRSQARLLLQSCAETGGAGRRIAVGDQSLAIGWVVVTAAGEIAVHGWDVSVACGVPRSIPDPLALGLLSLLQLVVTDATRPPLFGPEIPVSPLASPSDQLVAFLGRRPVPVSSGRVNGGAAFP
ncbi:TIGR03086 family metal-binding protein [Dactylosporangium cerinum]|uniref:TIGR03086 family metal-binding protein n=1 Tax=Dactylosporangium cerinum TaxID=1434730 RepID=A0ABV9WIK9_9ACTN